LQPPVSEESKTRLLPTVPIFETTGGLGGAGRGTYLEFFSWQVFPIKKSTNKRAYRYNPGSWKTKVEGEKEGAIGCVEMGREQGGGIKMGGGED